MPPVGFDRKEDDQVPSNLTTDAAITNKDDLEEIGKIRNILNPNEEVFVVARQSRLKSKFGDKKAEEWCKYSTIC